MLTEEQIEQLARKSFELYKDHRNRNGLPIEYERYEDQPETLLKSGRDQIRDIENKVSMLGYRIEPEQSVGSEDRIDSFTAEEIETLAVYEHERWVKNRIDDGWQQGPVKDVDRKITPYLVSWDELTEQVKDYDREPVKNIIPLLSSAGYVISR